MPKKKGDGFPFFIPCGTLASMGPRDLLGTGSDEGQDARLPWGGDPLEDPRVLSMIFHPRRDWAPFRNDPKGRDLCFDLAEGVVIGARFFLAGCSCPTLLFFHGNGEIASDYDEIAPLYNGRDLNLLVVDYRGYGRSTGTPTLRAVLQDAERVLDPVHDWLAAHGVRGRLWVMGRSLGSAPAIHLARLRGELLAGLIVESGFADTLGLLSRVGVPVHRIRVPEDWRSFNLEGIAQVKAPTLIIHGEWDQIIPLGDGKALFDACGASKKELVVIPGAGHNDLLWVGMEQYMAAIAGFVAQGSS